MRKIDWEAVDEVAKACARTIALQQAISEGQQDCPPEFAHDANFVKAFQEMRAGTEASIDESFELSLEFEISGDDIAFVRDWLADTGVQVDVRNSVVSAAHRCFVVRYTAPHCQRGVA